MPVLIALCVFFGSCGIENYLFLPPVPAGDIHLELNSRAEIALPDFDMGEYYYFSHFTIYYRIYISDSAESGDIQLSQTNLGRINSSLASHYAALSPYTNNDTTNVSTAIASQFNTLKYYTLYLENAHIDDILGADALGGRLSLDFTQTPGRPPTLSVNGQAYQLYRSTGDGNFNPRPNRFFLNDPELNSSENAGGDTGNSLINNDVANKTISASLPRYTYVNMYILAAGSDDNYVALYSRPTHIGILRLPDPK